MPSTPLQFSPFHAPAEEPSREPRRVSRLPEQVVKICSPEGTFEVVVACDARVDDLVVAIGDLRGITHPLYTISVFIAGGEDPLAGGCLVATSMADANVNELFMLCKPWSDRLSLLDLFRSNDGDNWDDKRKENWGTDAPLSEWAGVKVDADENVTELDLYL